MQPRRAAAAIPFRSSVIGCNVCHLSSVGNWRFRKPIGKCGARGGGGGGGSPNEEAERERPGDQIVARSLPERCQKLVRNLRSKPAKS
eukprot:764621-Hanusia_phi.AAC.1